MESLPKLYDMRITYRGQEPTDWYGPYALTDDDVNELKNADRAAILSTYLLPNDPAIRTVKIREHECDDPVNGGCGHMQESLPAPY